MQPPTPAPLPTNRKVVYRPVQVDPTQRRRRPSGEPAPLPREPLAGLGWLWVISLVAVLIPMCVALALSDFFASVGLSWDFIDQPVAEWFVAIRTDALTQVARGLDLLRNDWFLAALRWATVAALLATAQWRHLYTFIVVVLGTELFVVGLSNLLTRPHPMGVEILTDWTGYSAPSLGGAAVAATLVAMVYALVVPGRWRRRMLWIATLVIISFGLARIYLGVDRLTDIASGEILAVSIAVLAFRLLTPDAAFPVSYSHRKTAHLEMSDVRRHAIVTAIRDQLGMVVTEVELFGLEGSGGSTPLRIRLEDGSYVFGKLYAKNHLRSDRWYKLGRTILYGALEDESPFRTVRRLAQHEDHLMRLMQDAGVPIPAPLGIVELTPGREYMLVTEFLEGVEEMSKAAVDETVVDAAMWSISKMWDQGLAHRDIKPANVLVGADGIWIIDHAFGEIRPSPWRQAVDLANMMLALSPHLPTDVIYARACDHFTEGELAEAFAASGGVTIPGELRSALRAMDTDALAEFRALAPDRPSIRTQRWTRRRLLALLVLASTVTGVIWLIVLNQAVVRRLL